MCCLKKKKKKNNVANRNREASASDGNATYLMSGHLEWQPGSGERKGKEHKVSLCVGTLPLGPIASQCQRARNAQCFSSKKVNSGLCVIAEGESSLKSGESTWYRLEKTS